MSFVFKPIEPAYVTKIPYYVNKLWQINNGNISNLTSSTSQYVDSDISMSIYYGKYYSTPWITTASEVSTNHGEYARNIWNSTYNLYYRDFQNAPYNHHPQGNIGVETRRITDEIHVYSIPNKLIGLGIQPGSFEMESGSFYFFDDGNGNILGYDTTLTSGEIDSSSFNPKLKDFFYCSFYFDDGYRYNNTRATFKEPSYGTLGKLVNHNYDSDKGVAAPTHIPKSPVATVNNVFVRDHTNDPNTVISYMSQYHLDFSVSSVGSMYVRIPHTKELNFDTNQDFAVSFWIRQPDGDGIAPTPVLGAASGSVELISKSGLVRKYIIPVGNRARQLDPNTDASLYDHYVDTVDYVRGPYPFKIELIRNGYSGNGKIRFSRSDGTVASSITSSIAIADDTWALVTCQKSGSALQVWIGGTNRGEISQSCLTTVSNFSDVLIGCRGDLLTTSSISISDYDTSPGGWSTDGSTQFGGKMGPIHFFNRALSAAEIADMATISTSNKKYQRGIYNNRFGNIIYDQGQIIWTNPTYLSGPGRVLPGQGTSARFDYLKFRSTKLITTNEAICVAGATELNMTTNPTILINKNGKCNPGIGINETGIGNEDGECYSFVTGSNFSPYITTVGLYNDAGELLVVGKLSAPLRKPTNCDTVFVVKWDQ
jgi:hypothetical protein